MSVEPAAAQVGQPPVPSPDPDDSAARQGKNYRRHRWYCWILIVVVLTWIVSAGRIVPHRDWPSYYSYYCELADAFLAGQLNLQRGPDPRLLALPDPYDHIAGYYLKRHDLVLYDGKYYLYWGPVPALFYVPLRLAFATPEPIKDTNLVLAFSAAMVLVSGALMARVRERFFPRGSHAVVLLMMVTAGLAMPLPYINARAAVYEAAILGGQVFLLTGLYFAMTAFHRPSRDAVDVSALRLCLAGAAWALAVGSRYSLAPAVIALAALVVLRLYTITPRRGSSARIVRTLGAFSVPLAVGAALLCAYNYARFGSAFEFGQRYQLAGFNLIALEPYLFSVGNVLPNAFSFAFRPWRTLDWFPYILARYDLAWLPPWIKTLPYYHTDHITGLLWTSPLLLLCMIPAFVATRRVARRIRGRPGEAGPDTMAQHGLGWLVAWLLVAAVVGFAPALMLIGSTMRYIADLTPALCVLVAIAAWQVEGFVIRRGGWRAVVPWALSVLVSYSVAVAMLLAITGHYDHFKTHNPVLLYELIKWFPGELPKGQRLPSGGRPVYETPPPLPPAAATQPVASGLPQGYRSDRGRSTSF